MSDAVRQEILTKVRGQSVTIADITALYPGWSLPANPNAPLIREVVENVLATHSVSPAVAVKFKKGRLDTMTALLYPFAGPERFQALADFVCWMFLVDDEIDQCSNPGLNSKSEFDALVAETMHFTGLTLGVGQDGVVVSEGQMIPMENIPRSKFEAVETFRKFGFKLRSQPASQRRRFWWALKETFDGYATEQTYRLSQQIPQIEVYERYRCGSSCCYQWLVLLEYANDLRIPDVIMDSLEMKEVLRAANSALWVENDMVSAKKEVNDGFVENLVVLASGSDYTNVQTGFDYAVSKVRTEVARFDTALQALQTMFSSLLQTSAIRENLDKFIEGIKGQVTGQLEWSLKSERYGLANLPRDAKGCIEILLGEADESLMTLRKS